MALRASLAGFLLSLSGCCFSGQKSSEKIENPCVQLVRLMSDDAVVDVLESWHRDFPRRLDVASLSSEASGFRGMGAYSIPFPKQFSSESLGLPTGSQIRLAVTPEGRVTSLTLAVSQGVGIEFEMIEGTLERTTLEQGRRNTIGVLCLRPPPKLDVAR